MSPLRNVRSWLDERFGWDDLVAPLREEDCSSPPALLLVLPRRHHSLPVRHPGGDRDPAASVLPARRQRGFRERAVHHDPGAVWLADSVHPLLVRQPDDLYCVCAHVQRAVPQGLPQTAGS